MPEAASAFLFSAAVEGDLDREVVCRIAEEVGIRDTMFYVCHGKAKLFKRVDAFNAAARHRPWILLVDLDREECPAVLRHQWIPHPSRWLCFRIAVREVESWLLADREQMAKFLGVASKHVPQNPDSLNDPKQVIVNLSRRSRQREIQEDMVPRAGSGRAEGPAYASRLIEFVHQFWRPSIAEKHSESLLRCQRAIKQIFEEYHL
jgi:hypothetical protein